MSEDLGEIRKVMHDLQADLSDIRNAVDLRAMMPPISLVEELQSGDDVKSMTNGVHENAAFANGVAAPAAALYDTSAATTTTAQMYGESHVQVVPLVNSSPDANLGADNPWSGGMEPVIAKPAHADPVVLSDDSPWAK